MRMFVAALVLALSVPAIAGNEPPATTRPARTESAPKTDMDRPNTTAKPVDGKALCTLVNPDQNAPSERGDCVAEREPVQQRPSEKSPPAGPNNDATASAR
jgi:hypothetical protein